MLGLDVGEELLGFGKGLTQHKIRIVGKGNHSVNHVQKIKPAVEEVCRELGLQYNTEANAGMIYVNLQGGAAVPPSGYQPPAWQQHGGQGQQHGGQHGGQHGNQGQQHGGQYNGGQQGGYPGGPQTGGYPGAPGQQQGGQNQQNGNNNNEEMEKLAKKLLPKVIKKLEGCCVVM